MSWQGLLLLSVILGVLLFLAGLYVHRKQAHVVKSLWGPVMMFVGVVLCLPFALILAAAACMLAMFLAIEDAIST